MRTATRTVPEHNPPKTVWHGDPVCTSTAGNPHTACDGHHPEDDHASARPAVVTPHTTHCDVLQQQHDDWKTDVLSSANSRSTARCSKAMSQGINIGQEPVLTDHDLSPPAAGSHSQDIEDSVPHWRNRIFHTVHELRNKAKSKVQIDLM
jgi:hypothetical protein